MYVGVDAPHADHEGVDIISKERSLQRCVGERQCSVAVQLSCVSLICSAAVVDHCGSILGLYLCCLCGSL